MKQPQKDSKSLPVEANADPSGTNVEGGQEWELLRALELWIDKNEGESVRTKSEGEETYKWK